MEISHPCLAVGCVSLLCTYALFVNISPDLKCLYNAPFEKKQFVSEIVSIYKLDLFTLLFFSCYVPQIIETLFVLVFLFVRKCMIRRRQIFLNLKKTSELCECQPLCCFPFWILPLPYRIGYRNAIGELKEAMHFTTL